MADRDYILILKESLEKKVDILSQLQALNQEQTDILQNPNATPDELEKNIEQKANLIGRLEKLDNGFATLFKRVEDALKENKALYETEIKDMQELIREITDRSSEVQVHEKKNSELAKAKFSSIRTQARDIRQSGKAVSTYYQNMIKGGGGFDPQFMDSKK